MFSIWHNSLAPLLPLPLSPATSGNDAGGDDLDDDNLVNMISNTPKGPWKVRRGVWEGGLLAALHPQHLLNPPPRKVAPYNAQRFKQLSQNVQRPTAIPEELRTKVRRRFIIYFSSTFDMADTRPALQEYNRHLDVIPNPLTAVRLPSIGNSVASTYINGL